MVHFTLSFSNYPNSITARCLYLVHDSYLNWLSQHLRNKLQCKNCNLLGLPMMVHNKTPFFRTIIFGWVLLCRVDKLPGCSVECWYLKGTAPRGLRNDHRTLEKQNPIEMGSWVGKRTSFCNCLVVSNSWKIHSNIIERHSCMVHRLLQLIGCCATTGLTAQGEISLRTALCKLEILLEFIFSRGRFACTYFCEPLNKPLP